MACINASFQSSHQFNIFAKCDVHGRACRLPVRTFVVWKHVSAKKRSLPSSTRLRECFHLSCVTTGVCHPLTYLFSGVSHRILSPCIRPCQEEPAALFTFVIHVVHFLFQTLRRLVVCPSHPIVFAFDLFNRGVSHPRTSSLGESATPIIANVSVCPKRSLQLSSCCVLCPLLFHVLLVFRRGGFSSILC